MIQLYNSIFSSIEISDILNYEEVINGKKNIDNLDSGCVSFLIPISNNIRDILLNKLDLNLENITSIPMRWIKGDTHPHVDNGTDNFEKTHLVYLTDSDGQFVIDNISYPIEKGFGYVFNEGLQHETIGTGLIPRLLIGPMSEKGLAVGGGFNISQPGGTTVYLKQVLENGVLNLYYNTSINTNWILTSLPLTIINIDTTKGYLIIEFTTDIKINNNFDFFICGTSFLQFGSTSLKADGSRPKFIINIDGYDGLISNGQQYSAGNNNIYIYNLFVDGGNYTTNIGGGWLGRDFFGHGSSNNYIVNSSSTGNIAGNAGGILGSNTAINNGTVKLIGCSSTGDIGLWGGGIVGRYAGSTAGTVICDECSSTGNISAYGGGIFGSNAGNGASNRSERAQAYNCYSIGNIADGGGGIFGENAGASGENLGEFGSSQAVNCYSRGNIALHAGGIFGQNAGYNNEIQNNNGITNAENCYSAGNLESINNGIYGQNKGVQSLTTSSYAANGNWIDIDANNLLTGFSVSPYKIGTTWTSVSSNTPYILTNIGYTPYTNDNISTLGYEPALVKQYSFLVIPGNTSNSALIQNTFSILQISEGTISSYNTITINNSSGVISTSKNTSINIYVLYIQVGLYNVTTVSLNINEYLFVRSNVIGAFNTIAKNTSDVMIAAGNSNNGLYYSIDKGITWIQSNKTSGDFWSVDINGSNAVAASKEIENVGEGIFYSIDSGKTWLITNKIDKSFRWIMISQDGSRAVSASDSQQGLWYSNNTGNGFNLWQSSNITSGLFRSVFISSNGNDAIAAGNNGARGIFYSINCGETWILVSNTNNQSMRSVMISPDGQYALAGAAGNSGIWFSKRTDNGFNTWSTSNITTGNWRSFAISTDGNKAIAASNSNTGIYYSILNSGLGFNNWIATNKNNRNFSIVSISPDGKTALAGSNSNEGIWTSYGNFNVWAITNITNKDYFSGIYTTNSQRAILSSDNGSGIVYSSSFNNFTLSPLSIDEGIIYNGLLQIDSLIHPIYSILYQPFNNLYITGNRVSSFTPFVYYLTKRFPIIIQAVYEGNVITRQFIIEIKDVPQQPVDITITNNKIPENSSLKTFVGKLNTTDPDENDTFIYQFINGEGDNDNAYFKLDGSNLYTDTVFNYNTKRVYYIRLRSTDKYGYSIEKLLNLYVVIPIANGMNLSSLLNVNKIITLNGTPTIPSAELKYTLLSEPKYGILNMISNGIYTYKSFENKVDSFNYIVSEGSMTSLQGTVVIHNFSVEDIDNIPKRQGTFTFDSITFDGDIWTFGTIRTDNFFQYIDFNTLGNLRLYNTS